MLVLPPRGGAFNDHDLHLYQYHPIPSYTILYHLIPSYTILYHPIPSYTILYHPIPSYTILYLIYLHLVPLCMCMCVSCIQSCTYVAKLATLQCQVTHSHGAWIHQIRYSLKAVPDFGNCLFSETKVERAWRSILLRTMTFASWRTLKGRFAYMFALAQTVMLLLHNMCDSPASCSAATSWELYSQVSLILSPFLACNIHLQPVHELLVLYNYPAPT